MWAKIRSWHRVKFTSRGGQTYSLCRRELQGPELEAFPSDERTCESCLRIAARKEDNA